MKRLARSLYLLFPFLIPGCAGWPEQANSLDGGSLNEKINADTGAVVLDVRTSKEFAEGHLPKSINYDWNGNNFQSQIKTLDKSKPIFVYCLSGGRSAKAAEDLRSQGFKNVYELKGGITQWQRANLPMENGSSTR